MAILGGVTKATQHRGWVGLPWVLLEGSNLDHYYNQCCMHACMHACMYVCMWVCMHIYIYMYTYIYIRICICLVG